MNQRQSAYLITEQREVKAMSPARIAVGAGVYYRPDLALGFRLQLFDRRATRSIPMRSQSTGFRLRLNWR
jgi:hypothetical protein